MPPSVRVMPFGKYRGERLTTVAQDVDYVRWLTQQTWFWSERAGDDLFHWLVQGYAEYRLPVELLRYRFSALGLTSVDYDFSPAVYRFTFEGSDLRNGDGVVVRQIAAGRPTAQLFNHLCPVSPPNTCASDFVQEAAPLPYSFDAAVHTVFVTVHTSLRALTDRTRQPVTSPGRAYAFDGD